jgi:hypothetical protein
MNLITGLLGGHETGHGPVGAGGGIVGVVHAVRCGSDDIGGFETVEGRVGRGELVLYRVGDR